MTYHLKLDIKGCLRNWNRRDWIGAVTDDQGKTISPEAFRNELLDRLGNGEKFFPLMPCEGFSPITGCPGHLDVATEADKSAREVASSEVESDTNTVSECRHA